VRELARRLGVTPAEVSVLVDQMEDHGFVERVRDEDDRRVVWVRLTTKAPAAVAVVLRAKRALPESFVNETPEEEREPFVRHLARFIPVLTRTRDETPAQALATLYPSCWCWPARA
jgi:MarR family transcriptional regulator, organic hydroperoxide resistance regulator